MRYFCLNPIIFITIFLWSCGTTNSNQLTELDEANFQKLANELQAKDLKLKKDSSQLTIEVNDSQLAKGYLIQPLSEHPDSIYFLALKTSQQLHELLEPEYEYDKILLNFKYEDEWKYSFHFCAKNCE